ncbi:DUF6168 family protein [Sediminicola sp. 1XM1-17]|uniref:DUF6168 family protein n=1 Tax=Sediminicola sp. 1XM1-17 TaxID=3127702 RepID=UPI0030788899
MLKKVLLQAVLFGFVLFFGFYAHSFVLRANEIFISLPLFGIYLFHALFSFLICATFHFLSNTERFAGQLGFIYLGSLLLKLLLFVLIFKGPLFQKEEDSLAERISLLVPVFLFLFFEVIIIIKILGRTGYENK